MEFRKRKDEFEKNSKDHHFAKLLPSVSGWGERHITEFTKLQYKFWPYIPFQTDKGVKLQKLKFSRHNSHKC